MKNTRTISILLLVVIVSCSESRKPSATADSSEVSFITAGDPISDNEVMSRDKVDQVYATLQVGDTLNTIFEGEVASVCQMKGCWMKVRLTDEETVMVRFKDYGFFVPKDIAGSRVLIEGSAFVSEVQEAERKHLAEDAGKSVDVVAQISGSEMQKGFEATGVRIF